jgi:phosphatidylinositol alpha-1,6-mannosyltransferase
VPSGFTKILLISSEFPPNVGGIGNHAYNLASALANEGFEVDVLTDIIGESKKTLLHFSSKQPFNIHWIERKKIVLQSYATRVFKALKLAKKADKVLCSGKFPLWLGALIRFRFPNKELVAVVHGTELDFKSTFRKRLTSYSIAKFDKVISVSNYTAQFLPKELREGVSTHIIHNGINGSEFDIGEVSPLAGNPSLITVGNVTDRKGQENVVNALPEIITYFPSLKYHIVGKPTNEEKVAAKAQRLRVEKLIQFHGAVPREQLVQKLKGSTIKLMLSNHTAEGDFEGFGIAVLEANAVGVPAIGSRDCGIADAIDHGKTGLLVNQHDQHEVAKAVKTIMDNYSFFASNAKTWAKQHDWKIIVKEYIAVLRA